MKPLSKNKVLYSYFIKSDKIKNNEAYSNIL